MRWKDIKFNFILGVWPSLKFTRQLIIYSHLSQTLNVHKYVFMLPSRKLVGLKIYFCYRQCFVSNNWKLPFGKKTKFIFAFSIYIKHKGRHTKFIFRVQKQKQMRNLRIFSTKYRWMKKKKYLLSRCS